MLEFLVDATLHLEINAVLRLERMFMTIIQILLQLIDRLLRATLILVLLITM